MPVVLRPVVQTSMSQERRFLVSPIPSYQEDLDDIRNLHILGEKLSRAWNCVTTHRITNCLHTTALIHAGFSTDNAAPTFNDDDNFDVEDDLRHS